MSESERGPNPMPEEHVCDKKCWVCDRPFDMFEHVHIVPDATRLDRELIMCIPCITALTLATRELLSAYHSGGFKFDEYARMHYKEMSSKTHRAKTEGHPMPGFMEPIIDEIIRMMQSDDDKKR